MRLPTRAGFSKFSADDMDSTIRRRLIFGAVFLALAVNLAVGAKVYRQAAQTVPKDSAYPSLELFSQVLEIVRRDYVDGTNLTYKELVFGALDGMVGKLDPHSEFMEATEFKELQDDTQGAFGGLGIVVSIRDGHLTVVAPMEESPGFNAGIRTGDRIVRIGDKSTERMGTSDAVKLLRGEPGTEVSLTVFRPSTSKTRDYTLKRALIKVDMVKDIQGRREFPVDPDGIGYLRITQFGDKTSGELNDALKKLKAQGLRALVLDLRWNPGGLLDQAVDVCEKFLPRGQLVVSTEGRNPSQNRSHRARGRGDQLVSASGEPLPMVVLVNNGSASASEIVAGCLQDLKRAIVLGEKTFGKGSVQSILPLPEGSALRLTTAKYYTPSHKVIHEQGITPDILVALTDDEERDIQLQRVPGGVESLEPGDRERVRAVRDPQLERAVDLLKGISLFTQRVPASPPPGAKREAMAAKGAEALIR